MPSTPLLPLGCLWGGQLSIRRKHPRLRRKFAIPEEQKPREIPAALAELAKMLPPELVDQLTEAAKQASGLGGLTVTRSDAYKAIYANAYRTRIGTGDVTIVFNKAAHTPSILAAS